MSQYQIIYDDGYYITYNPINKEDEHYYYDIDLYGKLNSLEELLLTIKNNEKTDTKINNPHKKSKWTINVNYYDDIVLYESDDLESILNLNSIDNPELFI